jgi:galactokinase
MREVHADAPGRVNLIGEHTDYHDGFVLPCAVPQRTRAVLTRRDTAVVRASSTQMPGMDVAFTVGDESRRSNWGDYVQGVTWALRREGLTVGGFDVRLQSDVPVGSGLSSSASLEVAVLRAVRAAFALDLSDVDLARIAHRAEVEFVGAPVGIMDQMASSLAGEREALFLDTRTLRYEGIPLPSSLALVVINSGITHQHAGGDYGTRRRESEAAAASLGVAKLRDIGIEELPRLAALPPVLARRARHVITENDRVLKACDALRRGDDLALGRLFNASHASMRDDYEVSVPDIDCLVTLATQQSQVFGARMTGGGFGGAVVIAADAAAAADVATAVTTEYRARTGRPGSIVVPASAVL